MLNVYPNIESLKEKDVYLAECCESSLSEKPYEFWIFRLGINTRFIEL